MLAINCLGLGIFFLISITCPILAQISSAIILPDFLSDAYQSSILDLAMKYGEKLPCNWEEHEADINLIYDQLSLRAPENMNEWVNLLTLLAQKISALNLNQEEVLTPVDISDDRFIRFCFMLAASMLFELNYQHYIKSVKERNDRFILLEEHKKNCFKTLQEINDYLDYSDFTANLISYYYSIHEKKIPKVSVYYTEYEQLDCFTIKFILEILSRAYFHWNIIEQRHLIGLGLEDFTPDSDHTFETFGELESQDDLDEIGMNRCCFKTSKSLMMIAQNSDFERDFCNDIVIKIKSFNSSSFIYSPIVLAGLIASSLESAQFLASSVLEHFDKMSNHFIYLIFSNPFSRINLKDFLDFAKNFITKIPNEQINNWHNQQAELAAWKNILQREQKS